EPVGRVHPDLEPGVVHAVVAQQDQRVDRVTVGVEVGPAEGFVLGQAGHVAAFDLHAGTAPSVSTVPATTGGDELDVVKVDPVTRVGIGVEADRALAGGDSTGD